MVKHACTLSKADGKLCTRDYRDKAALIRHEKIAHGYYRRRAKACAAKANNKVGQASERSVMTVAPDTNKCMHTQSPARKQLFVDTEVATPEEYMRFRPRFESKSDFGFPTDSDTSDSSAGHDDYVTPYSMSRADFRNMWPRSDNPVDRALAIILERVSASVDPNGVVRGLSLIE
ncbi:hypothetical protein EW145_g5545 [Phellinidium pouzarii]|uniref:Uncharacterized protein n=1 Tax=Phellinidium pouzarii TaxID=167371 RepID=A0A4V3XC43_9AGAM|nr:hypothetical protein EW145_g5545 [Phellinidium pouzarii]